MWLGLQSQEYPGNLVAAQDQRCCSNCRQEHLIATIKQQIRSGCKDAILIKCTNNAEIIFGQPRRQAAYLMTLLLRRGQGKDPCPTFPTFHFTCYGLSCETSIPLLGDADALIEASYTSIFRLEIRPCSARRHRSPWSVPLKIFVWRK